MFKLNWYNFTKQILHAGMVGMLAKLLVGMHGFLKNEVVRKLIKFL